MWWRSFHIFSKAKLNPKLNNKQNTKSDYLFSNLIPNLPNVMRWPPHGGPFTSFQHAKAGGWWLFRTVGRSENLGGWVEKALGLICLPLVEIGLTDIPKSGEVNVSPAPLDSDGPNLRQKLWETCLGNSVWWQRFVSGKKSFKNANIVNYWKQSLIRLLIWWHSITMWTNPSPRSDGVPPKWKVLGVNKLNWNMFLSF